MTVMTSAQAEVSNAHYYANQTPYGNPASTKVKTPPPGYQLLFLQTVARHGSRSLTNSRAEQRALAIWRSAAAKGMLTTRGQQFDDDVATFQKAERKIGYGDLSTVGKDEWRGIGRRTADNYASFLTSSSTRGDRVQMVTSPVYRTKQSAQYLQAGLNATVPELGFRTRKVDRDLVITDGSTSRGKAAVASIKRRSSVRAAAKHLLARLYRPSYVNSLSDPVDAALDIYLLYSTAPGMAKDTRVTFADYVPLADAAKLAAVKDAQNFYSYGPGVAGETRSFRQAQPVLDDFFRRLDQRIAGGKTAVYFRLGHGETTMPFAALIKAPGSGRQAGKKTPFTYRTNGWRGYVAGRLAGNIEWAAYRNGSGNVLVTMRYNEQPVKFRSACTPSAAGGGYFYRLSQLKKCLG